MGRSGGGGGGGHSGGFSHSSGSRGFSRSGGSSSRSGAGGSSPSSGFGGFGGSLGSMGRNVIRSTVYQRNYYGPGTRRYSASYQVPVRSGVWSMIMTAIIVIIMVGAMIFMMNKNATGGVQSTIPREKLSNPDAFVSSCIVDELGWMNGNGAKAKKGMQQFWKETGVQPYIVLTEVTPETDTDAEREAWAQQYFDTHCSDTTFMYVYFETGNNSVKGPDVVWYGPAAAGVMDDEAIGIFLNYLDSYWSTWDADDTDGMFNQIFTKTSDTIMHVTTTGKDLVKYGIVAVIVIAIGTFAIIMFNKKRAAERERAAETERILQAGQNQQTFGTDDSDMDDLTSRYD